MINFHVKLDAACVQITIPILCKIPCSLPPFTSSFFGVAHRPPVYLFFFSCPEAMDRKGGCVIFQPTLPETAVSTLDFVRAEGDQLLVSGAFLLYLYWSSRTEKYRAWLCLFLHLWEDFVVFLFLRGSLSVLFSSVMTPWPWHVSIVCHVNICATDIVVTCFRWGKSQNN